MRPRFLSLVAAAAIGAAPVGVLRASSPPTEIRTFSRTIPSYFERLEEFVATERIEQATMRQENATVYRKQILLSDYQIAHLGEDPNALWEFRFIRSIDGKNLDTDRQIQDFFRLRHPSAAAERRSIVQLAMDKSFPGCYWHNLTLSLLAFEPETLDDFDWERKGSRWLFKQARGPGIPEDLFDPTSPRDRPEGELTVRPDGSPERLELEWTSRETRSRVTMTFSPPGADGIALPERYEAVHARLSTGTTRDRTVFTYSNFRRFTVSTDPATSSDPPPR